MREMKDSGVPWLKEIPVSWKVERGKNVLVLQKRPVRENDEVVTCFRDGEVILRSLRRTEGFTMSDKEIGYQGINEGDIVIHGMDGFAGAMGVSKSTGKGSPVLIVCTPKYDAIPQYIIYYLRALAMTDVFVALATGIRERSCDLRWNKVSELEFIMPSSSEQQKIVEFLDRKCAEVDEMIGLQEQIIEELKAYKQSVITEAVTKGLNPDAPMRDSGIEWIGQIPEHWEVHRLKSLFSSRVSGEWGDDAKQDERDRICLRIADFDYQRLRFKECESYTIRNYIKDDADLPYLAKGDILIEKSGGGEKTPVGRAVIYDLDLEQVMYANFMTRLRVKSHICPWFVKYILSAMYSNKAIYVYVKQTTGIQNLDLTAMLENEIVHLPSLTEQQAITDYLEEKCADIDSLIQTKLSKIDSLKEYKKSIIYEYVTGKREVTE